MINQIMDLFNKLKLHLLGMNFRGSKKQAIILSLIAVLLILVFGFGYFKYQKNLWQNLDPNEQEHQEVLSVESNIRKLIELPDGEVPTMITVENKENFGDQPFFALSQNGDKILTYTSAGRAFLYRPSTGKLVDTINLKVATATVQTKTTSPTVEEIRIVLRNGTEVNGLAKKLESEIKKVLPSSQIIKIENASVNDYEKTLVILLNEDKRSLVLAFSELWQASPSALPQKETKPNDADVLIIIGKDKISQ